MKIYFEEEPRGYCFALHSGGAIRAALWADSVRERAHKALDDAIDPGLQGVL